MLKIIIHCYFDLHKVWYFLSWIKKLSNTYQTQEYILEGYNANSQISKEYVGIACMSCFYEKLHNSKSMIDYLACDNKILEWNN